MFLLIRCCRGGIEFRIIEPCVHSGRSGHSDWSGVSGSFITYVQRSIQSERRLSRSERSDQESDQSFLECSLFKHSVDCHPNRAYRSDQESAQTDQTIQTDQTFLESSIIMDQT